MDDEKGEARGGALSLAEVAERVQGRVTGNASLLVRGIAPLEQAGGEDLAFLADRRYLPALEETHAAAVLVSAALADEIGEGVAAVVVPEAHAALANLLPYFHPPAEPAAEVHATAVLAPGVRLGRDVRIGAYAVLEEDCEIGDRVRIGPHVVVGRGATVGEGSVLHAHAVLYPRTVLGRRVIVHSGACLGSDGFGYAFTGGAYRKVPQVGRCVVEDDVEIGANTCIDRGSIGQTTVGAGSKLDNLVHLAHNVRVGPRCAMAAQVGIAGSTQIGEGVVFGGQAGLVGHLSIGDGARISAQAGVIGDVAPGETVAGFPAREIRTHMRGAALLLRLPELMKRLRALEKRVG